MVTPRRPSFEGRPDTNLGHFRENMVELWIGLEGQLDFLVEGEPLVIGAVGYVVQAPNERWHRATLHSTGMATRLAITPRNKEGQVHPGSGRRSRRPLHWPSDVN